MRPSIANVIAISGLLFLFLQTQSCSQNSKVANTPKGCFQQLYNYLDKKLTKGEKEKIINSNNIIETHKFGALRINIAREYNLGNGNSCIEKYYVNKGVHHPITITALILERYKQYKKQEK